MTLKNLKNKFLSKLSTYNSRNIVFRIFLIIFSIALLSIFLNFQNKRNEDLYKNYIKIAEQQISDGKNKEAIETLNGAIKLKPKEQVGYVMRAFSLGHEGRYNEALQDTDSAVSINGIKSAEFYNLRGILLRNDKRLEESLDSYSKAYELEPLNRDIVHSYLGGLIYFDKDKDAYPVIMNYINNTNKDDYWNDVDIWVDKATIELAIKKCSDAGASAWHVLMRSEEGSDTNKVAGAIMKLSLEKSNCSDK
ncbi:MAG: hypothetical protein WCK60_00365 [Candidatus Nomurabacteria bacterium]